MCILPSSLTRVLPYALDSSSRLPVSVSGTVPYSLSLEIISRHRDSCPLRFFVNQLALTPQPPRTDLPVRITSLESLDRENRLPAELRLMRHPLETVRGTGILTSFPSTTLFSLALGAD